MDSGPKVVRVGSAAPSFGPPEPVGAAPVAGSEAPAPSPPSSGPPPSPIPPEAPVNFTAPAAPPIADGLWHRLDPAAPRAEAIGWWILTAILGGIGAIALLVLLILRGAGIEFLIGSVLWLLLLAVLVLATLRWPRIHHAHCSYMVHPRGIEIRRGVFWRTIISVPRSRVQHTDVVQGPILRRYGLATLAIHTAGTEHAMVMLGGVTHETATRIRDFLIGELVRDGV